MFSNELLFRCCLCFLPVVEFSAESHSRIKVRDQERNLARADNLKGSTSEWAKRYCLL